MPYIEGSYRRLELDPTAHLVADAQNVGELNFQISRLVDDYVKRAGHGGYAAINAAIGALECAKLELYRRIAAPYEDEKIKQNGDVYR